MYNILSLIGKIFRIILIQSRALLSLFCGMKTVHLTLLFFLSAWYVTAQDSNTAILQTILSQYYKKEKPVYKDRSQLLYLYCNQANNNEEMVEAAKNANLPEDFLKEIRTIIYQDLAPKDWSNELSSIFQNDKSNLKMKIKECVSHEKYKEVSTRLHLNNQRLMIVGKPIYYSKANIALVKVVFYRNIEHNSSSILLLEKNENQWVIKEYLNSWST